MSLNELNQVGTSNPQGGGIIISPPLKIFMVSPIFRISTLLVYKIPMEDALPLSKAFSMLEKGMSQSIIKCENINFKLDDIIWYFSCMNIEGKIIFSSTRY